MAPSWTGWAHLDGSIEPRLPFDQAQGLLRPISWRDPFDEEFGTNTGGICEIRSLDVLALPAARCAVRYGPSGVQCVRSALDKLPIDHTRFTFIDYGSGKGRFLFLAAGFPFEEVIGIEFSRELHETALRNLTRLTPEITRCGKVSGIHADAALFEPPKSDLVCYFYNIIHSVRRSWRRLRRD